MFQLLTDPSEVIEGYLTVSWKPPSVAWEHQINWWCWETSMLRLAGSAQCGLVWLDVKGSGNSSSNGLLLLLMCMEFKLCITNTVFRLPDKLKCTYMHRLFKKLASHCNYVITWQRDISDIQITRVKHAELTAQWIIKWFGCTALSINQILHTGWMLLNHLKSWTPLKLKYYECADTFEILYGNCCQQTGWEPTRPYYQALECHSKKWSTMLP